MARTFTTFFSHNDNTYTAVISQLHGTVNIYVPDESLHNILPGGKATFEREKNIEEDTSRWSPAEDLLLKILSSIQKDDETRLFIQKETTL